MTFSIGKRKIGENSPAFIIAELSANHGQNYEIAEKMIYAAKEAGADAIKLQTYTPDTITIDHKSDEFKVDKTIWEGITLYDLYKKAYTPWDWHSSLIKLSNSLGMECFSTPFDYSAIKFLEKLNIPAYKVASSEINDLPLIKKIAETKKPIILSTGIAELGDIQAAIDTILDVDNTNIALLKCTASYPAPLEDTHLKSIPILKKIFGITMGLSDHTLGISVPIAAVALGAKIIEKHFILDRNQNMLDGSFSLEPLQFKNMVDSIRNIELALGEEKYIVTEKMRLGRRFARSIYVTKNIEKGEKFSPSNIRSIRPSNGLDPKYYNSVIGKIARKKISKGTPLSWDIIE